MYIFKIVFISVMGFVLVGCSGKIQVPNNSKKSFIIEDNKLPSSVHETMGRYRK
jgi:uncharacterized protein YcfL